MEQAQSTEQESTLTYLNDGRGLVEESTLLEQLQDFDDIQDSPNLSNYNDPTRVDKRRVPRRKGWQMATIYNRHHEIMNLVLIGVKQSEIAKKLGITEVSVSNVVNSEIGKETLTLKRAERDASFMDVAKDIKDLAPTALELIKDALETGKVKGKELSAKEIIAQANNIIDRTEGRPTQRIDSRNLNATLTLADIEEIKRLAQSMTR